MRDTRVRPHRRTRNTRVLLGVHEEKDGGGGRRLVYEYRTDTRGRSIRPNEGCKTSAIASIANSSVLE